MQNSKIQTLDAGSSWRRRKLSTLPDSPLHFFFGSEFFGYTTSPSSRTFYMENNRTYQAIDGYLLLLQSGKLCLWKMCFVQNHCIFLTGLLSLVWGSLYCLKGVLHCYSGVLKTPAELPLWIVDSCELGGLVWNSCVWGWSCIFRD